MADAQHTVRAEVEKLMRGVEARDPGAPEFHQAVREVVASVMPAVLDNPAYRDAKILERLIEPDRVVSFRVAYEDDQGEVHVHRAWRVQFSQALGPYKGGFRFHPSVTVGTLKFLGFEQVFKNSLTGLSLGGGKGGANFDPKGKSDREVMRFCRALMTELFRHMGPDTDVPAGDIGVGAREVGYLFGAYKKLENSFTGAFTGKGLEFGGSALRTEATGYGAVHFLCNMLRHAGDDIRGKKAVVSGAGNVAIYAMEKLEQLGARAITASDSSGFVHDPDGITGEKLEWLRVLKEERRGRIHAYAERFPGATFHPGERPWRVPADLALPCATQNELERGDAEALAKNGARALAEGANMPCTAEAVEVLEAAGVLFGPGKAANAGGVATSGLEMSQNSARVRWDREEVDRRLTRIMNDIHESCVEHGADGGRVDYVRGANLAGFYRVAEAMLAYGID
jgi:glutamate dehydrogenase (NADP+)